MRVKRSGLSNGNYLGKIQMWLVDNKLVNHNDVSKIIHVIKFSTEKDTSDNSTFLCCHAST